MSDTQLLLRRLQLLLALPVAVAACDREAEPATKAEQPKVRAETGATVKDETTTTAAEEGGQAEGGSEGDDTGATTETGSSAEVDTPPPPDSIGSSKIGQRLPTCPTETWCGSKRIAARYRLGADAGKACADKIALPGGFTWTDDLGRERKLSSRREADFDAKASERSQAEDPRSCCYTWTEPCPGGRPYADDEGLVRAPTFARVDPHAPTPAPANAALAAAWAEDAAMEHASVASFARVVGELLALAAPPALVRAASEAIQDELRHAQACYAIASRYAGVELEPGPLPLLRGRALSWASFVRDTFREGCVSETVAALTAARAAASCDDPEIHETLIMIANDEARHAALAWRSIAWALATEPASSREALRACIVELDGQRDRVPTDAATARPGPGRLAPSELAAARRDALEDIVGPLARKLLSDSRPAYRE